MNLFRASHTGAWRVPLFLFLGVYLFSGLSPIATSFDSRWTVYIAMSVWSHGDTNLDEYSNVIQQADFYAMECVDNAGNVRTGGPETCSGHWHNSYPIGGTILATPLIVAAVGVMHLLHPLLEHFHTSQPVIAGFLRGDYDTAHALIEEQVGSAFLAAAAVAIFFIARLYLPVKRAVVLALLFGMATSAYSVGDARSGSTRLRCSCWRSPFTCCCAPKKSPRWPRGPAFQWRFPTLCGPPILSLC